MNKKQYRKMYLTYIQEREIYYGAGERFIEDDVFETIERHNLDEYLHDTGQHLLTRDEMGYEPHNAKYAKARANRLAVIARQRLEMRGR